MKKVLVVVDMQNDFIDGALGTKEAVAIVPKVKRKIEEHANKSTILFTRDTHAVDYLKTQEGSKLPVPHCIMNTEGWQISDALDTNLGSIVDKPTFGSVALAEYIKTIVDCEEVELVGLCTDICVISNALLIKAYLPEVKISVDAACCAGVTPESHRNALNAMKMCQIDIINDYV